MAEFGKLIITEKGKALLMKTVNSECRILFSKIAVSDVGYAQEDLASLDMLEGVRQMTALSEIETDGPDSIRIHAILPNTELGEGYYLRAVGLYAEDPDEGEILYGVSIETSEYGCYVPPFRGRTASSLYFNLSVTVGNSENVTLEVDQGAAATVKQLNKVRYPEFEMAKERENLVSGERQDTLFGKIARWFADLKAVAFSGSYRDLSDKPALGSAAPQEVANNDTTTSEGYVADARVAKVHGDEIDSLNTALAGHKTSGDHDGRYYTEGEVNNLLAGKSATGHVHDERYYTEAEVNNLLAGKLSTTASCNRNWNWSGQAGQPTWLWGGNDAANMYVYSPANFRVNYANVAGVAGCLGRGGDGSVPMTFYWNGQDGQPTWLWGGNDGNTMYVYNPSNFTVSKCTEGIISPPANRAVDLNATGDCFRSYDGSLNMVTGVINLGSTNSRWKQLYAATATISTSDRKLKKDIKTLSKEYAKLFMLLQPVSFLFKDGESGRAHIGFIAQDVEDAIEECGLTDLDFAGFCKDIKTVNRSERDENGNRREIEEPVLDCDGNPEYIYSLRYEEFIALNTYMIQTVVNRMEKMDQRIAALEKRLAGSGQPGRA